MSSWGYGVYLFNVRFWLEADIWLTRWPGPFGARQRQKFFQAGTLVPPHTTTMLTGGAFKKGVPGGCPKCSGEALPVGWPEQGAEFRGP